MVYACNRILVCVTKGGNSGACYSRRELRRYHAELATKEQTPCDSTDMRSLESSDGDRQ